MKSIYKNVFLNEILSQKAFKKENKCLTLDIKKTNISFDNIRLKKSNDIIFVKNRKRTKSVNTKFSEKIFYNLLDYNIQIWKKPYEENNGSHSIK